MGYKTKIQVIQRKQSRQFYLMIPAQTAEALEIEKGEEIEWIIESKKTLIIKRNSIEKTYKNNEEEEM